MATSVGASLNYLWLNPFVFTQVLTCVGLRESRGQCSHTDIITHGRAERQAQQGKVGYAPNVPLPFVPGPASLWPARLEKRPANQWKTRAALAVRLAPKSCEQRFLIGEDTPTCNLIYNGHCLVDSPGVTQEPNFYECFWSPMMISRRNFDTNLRHLLLCAVFLMFCACFFAPCPRLAPFRLPLLCRPFFGGIFGTQAGGKT